MQTIIDLRKRRRNKRVGSKRNLNLKWYTKWSFILTWKLYYWWSYLYFSILWLWSHY
jgi:hypothetical protein